MGLDEAGAVTLAGSCKWTTDPMDVREYAALQSDLTTAGLIDSAAAEPPHLFLFSRSGFTSRLTRIATSQQPNPRLHLIALDDFYTV